MNDCAARFEDLAESAYASGRCRFSDFLGLAEQDTLFGGKESWDYAGLAVFGGADGCERVVARFGEDNGEPWPITLLCLAPLSDKFADALTHRDILGALMNVGIRRETVGDIFLHDNRAYVFCLASVAPVIQSELTRARHTSLSCTVLDTLPEGVGQTRSTVTVNVASERADGVIAALYRLSREEASDLFDAEKVYVDGRLRTSPASPLREGQTVSVRGHGKFIYRGIRAQSRKGRLFADIEVYG